MIDAERLKNLEDKPKRDEDYLLYWIQASPRTHYNHALEYSIKMANKLEKPLLTYFGLVKFPEANEMHYKFLLKGLKDLKSSLENRGIQFLLRLSSPPEGAVELAENASMLNTDRGYLEILRIWIEKVIQRVKCPLMQIETNVMVPVEVTSFKEKYSLPLSARRLI